ncbi:MAG: hypothetical protein Q9192_003198 [Flavoplaca navasiana]
MDLLHGLSTHYPCFSHESHAGYLPEMAAFDYSGWIGPGQNPSGQNLESKEVLDLRSKLAVAESRVDELQKENAVAKNVIDYLLKQSGSASLYEGSLYTPQHANYSRAAEDVKEILNPIIGLLHDIVRAAPLCQNSFTQSVPHTDFGSGTLVDLLSDASEPGDAGKGVRDIPKPSSTPLELAKAAEPAEISPSGAAETPYAKQTDAPEANLMFLENDASFAAPLVTRFRNARGEGEAHKHSSITVSSTPAVTVHRESPDNLRISFDESETGLSGLTQYDASESASASSTSPSSSIDNSDAENNQDYINGNGKHRIGFEVHSIAPVSRGIFDARGDSGHKRFEDAGQASTLPKIEALASAHALMFMPKWSILPYIMADYERAQAIVLHQRHALEKGQSIPGFFRFGIRFSPNSTVGNVFRTVIVDNLPSVFALSTLLKQVRGGAVAEAKLLNTTGIHGRTSALISFVLERAAKSFEDRARSKPLDFDGLTARVVLLPSPTWPMAPALRTGVLQHGHTRCLQVLNFPQSIGPAELERDLQVCHSVTTHQIEAKRLRPNGVLELRFTSVKYAEMAWGVFSNQFHERYRQCRCKYMPDPCAQPWDEITTMVDCPMSQHEPCAMQPEIPNVGDTKGVAVTHWKEYAFETFTGNESRAEARIDTAETPEDNTCRLSDAGVDEAGTIQRGRSFTTEQSCGKAEDTCNQQ